MPLELGREVVRDLGSRELDVVEKNNLTTGDTGKLTWWHFFEDRTEEM